MLPFLRFFSFLLLSLIAVNSFAQSEYSTSLLQENPHIFNSWLSENGIEEFVPSMLRSDLPEHFFAMRIFPENSFDPVVFEINGRAAVLLWAMDVGEKEVVVLSEEVSSGFYFYNFEDVENQNHPGRLTRTYSSPLSGGLLLEWNGPKEKVEEIINGFNGLRAYQNLEGHSFNSTGFGASLDCHFNINCPEGENFVHVSDGISRVMVVVEEGIGFCSGTLINNTAQDFTPYLLSAFHCTANFTPLYHLWRFDFFYESQNCNDPVNEPGFISMFGAEFRAGHRDSDFLLLELNEEFPPFFEVPFLGWDRRDDYLPENTALVHHPAGDIKKVSLYSEPLRVHNNLINWNHGTQTPRMSHYRQELTTGAFEPGSSGSPLLSPEARIMGQLHGGVFGCEDFIAYSGILYFSWEVGEDSSERLKDWLDPLNTGQLTLDELYLVPDIKEIEITGKIVNPKNRPIPDVWVEVICSDTTYYNLTDSNGEFLLRISFIDEEECSVQFSKQDVALNGINVLDIVLIRRDILGLQLLDDWQKLAADVNNDGLVNVLDIVVLRRLILGLYDELPELDPWQFFPEGDQIELKADNDVFLEATGLKMGDLDYNADY